MSQQTMSRQHDPQNSKAISAMKAMKALGIKRETTIPVLKRLLKLYDNKWELIEEDNYRTLADAIFERQEEKEKAEIKRAVQHDSVEPSVKKHRGMGGFVVEHDPPEPSLKKHHSIKAEDETSPRMDNGDMLDTQNDDIRQSSSAVPAPGAPKIEVSSSSARQRPRNNFEDPLAINGVNPIDQHMATRWAASSETHQVLSKHIKGFDDTNNSDVPQNAKVGGSEPLNHHINSPIPSPGLCTGKRVTMANISSTYNLESSACGSMKVALQYNHALYKRTEQHVKKMSNGSGPTSFMASQEHPASPSLFIPDISKQTETVSISLVNEIREQKEPLPNFTYIPSNTIYQSAYVHVSLARIADDDCCSGCNGDCLSSAVPCACARDTGGEFAYTPEGLVKEEFLNKCILMNEKPERDHHFYCKDCPLERAKKSHRPKSCKGHLIRRFIKECWRKCGCNMSCGNRVVQRGLSRKLQVFLTSKSKGWGVRTLEALPKGAFVCEYVGEILTNTELFERNKKNSKDRHTYPVLLDADWSSESVLKDEEALCLDATRYGNVARFINHRCNDANLTEIPVEVENPDHHYYHLAFFTNRKVDALEELTWDYQIDFEDQNHPVKAFQCCCGSASCRDRKGKRKLI